MAKFWIVGDGGEAIPTSALLQLSKDWAGGCWWLCWAAWGLTSANRDGVWVSLTGAAVIAPSERQRREKFCQKSSSHVSESQPRSKLLWGFLGCCPQRSSKKGSCQGIKEMQNGSGFVLHEHKNVEKMLIWGQGWLVNSRFREHGQLCGSPQDHLFPVSLAEFPPGFWVPSSLLCIISFEDLLLLNPWCTVSCKCFQDTKELVIFLQLITIIWVFKESQVRPLSQTGKLSFLPSLCFFAVFAAWDLKEKASHWPKIIKQMKMRGLARASHSWPSRFWV